MTISEFRKSQEYADSLNKIKNYKQGFKFTLNYANIPKAKAKALQIITKDCIDMGILESISIGLSINGEFVDETYQRL